MTTTDLKSAIIGIVISNMEKYNSGPLTIIHSDQLHKNLKKDLNEMYNSWWQNHYPWFHYTLNIQSMSVAEPRVVINWTYDGTSEDNWRRLEFNFNPVRVVSDDDPIKAYDRAMGVI